MKRSPAIAAAFLAAAALAASPIPAEAKDLAKRFGIGADVTLSGGTGVSARYYFSNRFGVQFLLGMDFASTTPGSVSEQERLFAIFASARGEFTAYRSDALHLAIPVGVSYAFRWLQLPGDPPADDHQVAVEGGLRAEWFVNDSFSLNMAVGFTVEVYPVSGEVVGPPHITSGPFGEAGTAFFLGSYFFGSAGFTFWFR